MTQSTRLLTLIIFFFCATLVAPPVEARRAVGPAELENADVTERLGEQALIDASFQNHLGQMVRLEELLADGKPVLLTLNYYRCEMLCDLQLNGLLESLKEFEWAPGENFHVVTVSIDPREDAEIAAGKRAAYIEALGRGEVDWQFLVGNRTNTRALADSVGFGYQYDASSDQYAHVALATLISPDGLISSYIYGIEFEHETLREGILNASAGQIIADIERPVLNCFHFEYTDEEPLGTRIMRIGGIATVLIFGLALIWLWRRDIARTREQEPGA